MQILDYTKGLLPLSTGISLSLERLNKMGIKHEESPITPKELSLLNASTHLYVNLRTLYRSVFSSLDELSVRPQDMAVTLAQEVENLYLVLDGTVDYKLTPIIYFPTYEGLPNLLPRARMHEAHTDLQKERLKLEIDTYAKMDENTIKLIAQCKTTMDLAPPNPASGGHPRALMLTHYPVDLLARERFSDLNLLESNTGAIKGRELWSTKMIKQKQDSCFIPFNKMTLTVFGDQNKLIRPYAPGPKNALLDIARRNKWNTLTTNDRIRQTLSRERDAMFAKELMRML